jgi:hypothetical protein
MRDFSVWPVGSEFMSATEKATFEQHKKDEKQKMWNRSPQ